MTDIFFPVVERPLDIRCRDAEDLTKTRHVPASTHKAICRPDGFSDEPILLGVVGSGYKIVHNSELFSAVEEAIEKGIPPHLREGAVVHDKVSNHGAFCLREYVFPNFQVKLKQPKGRGDTSLGYRSILWNTYDGSGAAKLLTGAIDFFCTNGQVSGEFEVFKRRHTSGFRIPAFGELIENNIQAFTEAAREWQRWAEMDLTREEAAKVLKDLPGLSESRAEKLMMQFNYETYQRGATVWALYSAMTWFASHAKGNFTIRNTGTDHLAQTMQRREEQVLVWVRSKAWKEMVGR